MLKLKILFKKGVNIMKKVPLRFGKNDLFFWIAATLCTERVTEPEKSYLLSDSSNFEELILEIIVNEPTGVFRRKSFFFELNDYNLKEARIAFRSGEIANWYIRKITVSDAQLNSQINQTL